MEIHAPEGHMQSFRDVALHLAIVTVGILIALGLEQSVEWFHHREIVAEAKENLREEILFNKNALEKQAAQLPKFRAAATLALDFITDVRYKGKSDIHSLNLNFAWARLRSTSWSTAQTIGAVAYMPYSDVEKYAAVYRLQQDYLASQSRTEESGVGAYSVFAPRNRLEKLSEGELDAERGRLMQMSSSLTLEIQTARDLIRAYDNLLNGRPVEGGLSESAGDAGKRAQNRKEE